VRVFVSPCDAGPCGLYRLVWPGRAAARHVQVEIADNRYIGLRLDNYINYLTRADTDVVVIQRPANMTTVDAIPKLRARGIAVVVDMDDDLSAVHPENAAYYCAREFDEYAVKACNQASLVTATTEAVANRYAPHGRVRIIPNYVPESYLKVPHRDSGLVGWGGALRCHPNDLNVLGESIANLVNEGHGFKVVGPKGGHARVLKLRHEPLATDGVPMAYWPTELSKLGIGIAPLAPSEFNAAKSRLRPLEYSSLGVPWVASPTPDYQKFHALGVGLLAHTPEEWEEQLRRLIADRYLRDELADAGREVAKENTIEGNAERWVEAWSDAMEIA
jgi:glycosyltransferase involved in cell wall biosynthesis